jgi:hypothetical protein
MIATMTRPPEAPPRTRLLGETKRRPVPTPVPTSDPTAVGAPVTVEALVVPTRSDIIKRTIAETRCTQRQAEIFYFVLAETAKRPIGARNHITQANLDVMHDAVMVVALPDDTDAKPGSLHDDVNRHLSGVVGRPVKLVHSTALVGQATHCTVHIELAPNTAD